jgi:hypothetical protein
MTDAHAEFRQEEAQLSDTAKTWSVLAVLVVACLLVGASLLPAALRQLAGIPPAGDVDCVPRAHEVDSWPFVAIDTEDMCGVP